MCRFAAYNGSPIPLARLTHEPAHSLLVQSYKPRQMREATLNADGTGAVWYPDDGDPKPCRYRSAGPLWSDENLEQLAPRIRSSMMLAIVRSATPGLPFGPASTPPFIHDRLSFMHNGYLEGFRKNFMRPVREQLTDEAYQVILGGTDTEHVFALFLDTLAKQKEGWTSGDALVVAMRRTIAICAEIALEVGARAVLNLVASDGKTLVATRYSSSGPTATLFLGTRIRAFGEGAVIASEPLDDDASWGEVPEDTLLIVEQGQVRAERLRGD
jgi:ergothioneine biosynthesis protein EgtC